MRMLSPEQSIRLKYENPSEVSAFAALNREGLTKFESAMAQASFQPGQLVLDVGCGGGREAIWLAQRGVRVVAMDLVREMVQAAQEHALTQGQRLRALAANLMSLPFRGELFDGATMLGQVIAHVWDRDARVAALRSVRHVLRPGGILAMTTHNRRCHWKFKLYFACVNRVRRAARALGYRSALHDNDRWCHRISTARSQQPVFLHMYDLDEAVADLRAAGFEVLHAKARAEYESGREDEAERDRDYLLGFIARRPMS